jgi:biotin carboxylase
MMSACIYHGQVPVLPGSGLLKSAEEAGELADGIGYPVLLKVGLLGSTSDDRQAGHLQC